MKSTKNYLKFYFQRPLKINNLGYHSVCRPLSELNGQSTCGAKNDPPCEMLSLMPRGEIVTFMDV